MCFRPAYRTKPIYNMTYSLHWVACSAYMHKRHLEWGIPTGLHQDGSFRTNRKGEHHEVLFWGRHLCFICRILILRSTWMSTGYRTQCRLDFTCSVNVTLVKAITPDHRILSVAICKKTCSNENLLAKEKRNLK